MTSRSTTQAYLGGVDRAIDVIIDDLDGDLSVDRLARAAGFSPFHFHRVFKSITGTTIGKYIDRARMDRVVGLLSKEPALTLSDIAERCGFGSASSLSKAFRRSFGVAPRSYDVAAHRAGNRRRKLGLCALGEIESAVGSLRVEISEVSERTVVYRRVSSPYEAGRLSAAIEELIRWADVNGFGEQPLLGYQWDDPDVVPIERCRYDIAIMIPSNMVVEVPFAKRHFPPTLAAHVTVDDINDEQRALDWLFDQWLPSSGFQPSDMPVFESWKNDGASAGDGGSILIQMPISSREGIHSLRNPKKDRDLGQT